MAGSSPPASKRRTDQSATSDSLKHHHNNQIRRYCTTVSTLASYFEVSGSKDRVCTLAVAGRYSVDQGFPCFEGSCSISPPPDSILNQLHPFPIPTPYFSNIHFSICLCLLNGILLSGSISSFQFACILFICRLVGKRMLVNDELKVNWKEAVVAYFNFLKDKTDLIGPNI